MGDLRSDSAMCRRIVTAFLDFLKSVEPAPGVDLEGLDVARDCLEAVFNLNQASGEVAPQPGLLINLFSSLKDDEQYKPVPYFGSVESGNDSKTQHLSGGDLRDELFMKFYAALDKINFFSASTGEIEDPLRVAKATQIFHDAIKEIENSQDTMNIISLAETFKTKGNLSMKLKLYPEAVEQYTFAIALHEKNAVFYCNRAAAYTHMEKYVEAIEDCLKSIEINPSYNKAYSRLGLVYYNQGNYTEALHGFLRALQLDPNNESIKENIRATQQKLVESSTFGTEQRSGSRLGQDSTPNEGESTSSSSSFVSFPNIFDNSSIIPPELVNIVRNAVSSATEGHHTQSDSNEPEAVGGRLGNNTVNDNEPHQRADGNINLNLSQAPEEVRDALRFFASSFSSQNATERH